MRRQVVLAFVLLAAVPVLAAETSQASPLPASKAAPAGRRVEIKVTEDGFVPREIKVKKGEPTTLTFTRVTESTCITAIDIPDEKVQELALPLNKAVSVTVTPKKRGVEKFHCSAMAMGDGRIVVED